MIFSLFQEVGRKGQFGAVVWFNAIIIIILNR